MQIDYPHIKELLRAGELFEVDIEVGKQLEEALNQLPWLGGGLDWAAMVGHRTINLDGLSSDDLIEIVIHNTRFADYNYRGAFQLKRAFSWCQTGLSS